MNLRRTLILAALSCIALFALAACGEGSPATPTLPPAPTSTPNVPMPTATSVTASPTRSPDEINITSEDFDKALAKWKAADVREYEIVASYFFVYAEMSGDWRLRVRDGKIVQIWRGDVEVYVDDGTGIPNPEANPDSLAFLTVEEQFKLIKKLLDDPSSRGLTLGGTNYEVEYRITFNDALGYPEKYAIYPVSITDNERITEIKQIRIIEQGPNATIGITPAPAFPTSTPRTDMSTPTAEASGEFTIAKDNPDSPIFYADALAKWQAAGITEYRILSTIQSEGLEQFWELHVKDDKVTVVSSSEGTEVTPADYDWVLPDKQFALMADVLAGNDSTGVVVEGQDFHIAYVVQIDPEFGYPTRFEMRVLPGPIYDMGYVITVEDFEVLGTK